MQRYGLFLYLKSSSVYRFRNVLAFGANGGTQSLTFQGSNIEIFDLNSSQGWCSPTMGVLFPANSLDFVMNITVEPQLATDSREAVIKIKNAARKEKEVKITQAGTKSFAGGSGTLNNPYLIKTAEQLDLIRIFCFYYELLCHRKINCRL